MVHPERWRGRDTLPIS
uniref:Uncharacterized protein n=1 Tax=Romanomermis culicivorax TaxID=13658 RepID=A0A915L4I0_ROMCU